MKSRDKLILAALVSLVVWGNLPSELKVQINTTIEKAVAPIAETQEGRAVGKALCASFAYMIRRLARGNNEC